MSKKTKDYEKNLLKDQKLLERLAKIEDTKEMIRVLENYGIKKGSKEIQDTLEFKEEVESLKLSEPQLEEIAGGLNLSKKLSAGALSLALGLGGLNSGISAMEQENSVLGRPLKCINALKKHNDNNLESLIDAVIAANKEPENKILQEKKRELLEEYEKTNNDLKVIVASEIEDNVSFLAQEVKNTMRSLDDALAEKDDTKVERLTKHLDALNNEMRMLGEVFSVLTIRNSAKNILESMGKWGRYGMYALGASFALKNSGDILDNIKNLIASGENKIQNAIFNLNHKGINILAYKMTLQKIENRLREELVGQDEAIDKMIKIMTGYFESLVQAKKSGKKHEGGLLLYLTGLPATGKSTAMKIIEEEMKLGSCTVRMSDIIEDKGNNAQTAASRLLKPTLSDNGKVKVNVDTNFARTIKAGRPTLYCIDEVDKMRMWDATSQGRNLRNESNKIMGGSIDEMLRNFGDTGQINGMNASGSILVATSNESPEDLKDLESSLYNRYRYCNIQFKDLTAEDYKEIIMRKSKDVKEYYKNKFNVNVEWDELALEHYSKVYEKEKSGGRGVDALINEVRAVLKDFAENRANEDEEDSSTWYLKFDNSKNSLVGSSY